MHRVAYCGIIGIAMLHQKRKALFSVFLAIGIFLCAAAFVRAVFARIMTKPEPAIAFDCFTERDLMYSLWAIDATGARKWLVTNLGTLNDNAYIPQPAESSYIKDSCILINGSGIANYYWINAFTGKKQSQENDYVYPIGPVGVPENNGAWVGISDEEDSVGHSKTLLVTKNSSEEITFPALEKAKAEFYYIDYSLFGNILILNKRIPVNDTESRGQWIEALDINKLTSFGSFQLDCSTRESGGSFILVPDAIASKQKYSSDRSAALHILRPGDCLSPPVLACCIYKNDALAKITIGEFNIQNGSFSEIDFPLAQIESASDRFYVAKVLYDPLSHYSYVWINRIASELDMKNVLKLLDANILYSLSPSNVWTLVDRFAFVGGDRGVCSAGYLWYVANSPDSFDNSINGKEQTIIRYDPVRNSKKIVYYGPGVHRMIPNPWIGGQVAPPG